MLSPMAEHHSSMLNFDGTDSSPDAEPARWGCGLNRQLASEALE